MFSKPARPTYEIKANKRPSWLAPLLSLLGVGGLLGLSTNLAKLSANSGLNPITLLIWSINGATILLTILLGLKGRLPRFSKQLLEYSIVSSLVGVVGPNLILYAAIPKVGAGFVTLSIAFPPMLTYLGALALRMEKFQYSRASGVILSLAGAVFMAILKLTAPDAVASWIIATLMVPVILAIGNIYRTLRWPKGAKTEELALGMLITSSIMLILAGLVSDIPLAVSMESTKSFLLIAVQTIAFAIQYILFFILQEKGGPVYLSLIGSVAAIVGVPIAVYFLGESVPEGLFIGSILIVLGIILVSKRKRKVEKQRVVSTVKRAKALAGSNC